MAGVTDKPFRQLCKDMGAGLACTEMVGASSLLMGSEKTHRRANHEGETLPCAVQIVGADPAKLAEAAIVNEANGAQIIDINMGCPAKKVCNTLAGSALLKDEPLVARILESIVKAVKIPVTLKIRTGWDPEHRNGIRIAKLAESLGIVALAVHGRTRACRFNGHAEYDTIRAIKENVSIPVIANGDISSPQKAKEVLDYTKADGIMIGRAAQGRPWIFSEINYYLDHGELLPKPSIDHIYRLMIDHLHSLYEFYGPKNGVHLARKHVSWYTKGQPNGTHFRNIFNRLDTVGAQLEAANAFFLSLIEGTPHDEHQVQKN
jgi:tRNA-dihydrouridine synthase B